MPKPVLFISVLLIAAGIFYLYIFRAPRSVKPLKFASTQEKMSWMANQAVDLAKDNYNVQLDYSPESIKRVEEILGKMHDDHQSGKLNSGINGLSFAMGAYIGECIRRSNPGAHWEKDHKAAGPDSYPLMTPNHGDIFPCGWCNKRILNGAEDNVWNKYLMLFKPDKMGPMITFGPSTNPVK